jgi:hypothetical protein
MSCVSSLNDMGDFVTKKNNIFYFSFWSTNCLCVLSSSSGYRKIAFHFQFKTKTRRPHNLVKNYTPLDIFYGTTASINSLACNRKTKKNKIRKFQIFSSSSSCRDFLSLFSHSLHKKTTFSFFRFTLLLKYIIFPHHTTATKHYSEKKVYRSHIFRRQKQWRSVF